MDIIKTVSQLIESQFPEVYREEGPQLVAFVKAYFQFLEQDEENSTKLARQLFDVNDIDRTLNQFVRNYKEKYLKDFPFISATDKRFMIKHIMDYYRSKGSEQGLELLMKMLYGEQIEIYYPGNDVLKPSDSKWNRPVYIEVSKSSRTRDFLDKQIRGSRSGAKAFVEGVVTKRANGKLIDLVYLSDVRGQFRRGDVISDDGNNRKAPRVLGSLSDIQISLGGRDNKIGDVFNVVAENGVQGQVRITEVENATGRVNFTLENGGGGYTLRSANGAQQTDIYISDVVLDVKNPDLDFYRFEKVEQPVETLYLLSSSDISEQVSDLDYVAGYSAAADYVANGTVISASNTYANGAVLPSGVQVIGIDIAANTFTAGQAITSDGNASGTITATEDQNLTISVSTGTFLNGDVVTAGGSSANVTSSSPGVKLKVLVTDQTFANQCLVTLSSNTNFRDGEVIQEEGIVKLSLEAETGSFVVGNKINQYITANTEFSNVETFQGDGVNDTFTHSANLESVASVTVTVDNTLQAINDDYTLDGANVVFVANSIPGVPDEPTSNNVLISAKTNIDKVIRSAFGYLTANGDLGVDNSALFNVGDIIVHEDTGATANVTLIEDGRLYFEEANGYFISGGKIQLQGTPATNTTITQTSVILSPSWGEWESQTLVKQGAIQGAVEENGVYVDTSNASWVGARGVVQNDGTLAADEVVIKDIFGEFNTSKQVRGDKTRKIATIATITPTGAARIRLNGDVNANGNVDAVTNNYVIGMVVGQNTSSVGIKYDDANTITRDTFTADEDGNFFINTRREEMLTPPRFAVSDLTFNIDATQTFTDGDVIDTITEAQRGRRALFETFVQFPETDGNLTDSSTATGTIWELGGSSIGAKLAIIPDPASPTDQVLLRLRAGDGSVADSTAVTGTDIAVIDVDPLDLPQDKNYHVLVWYINPDNGNIRLWIDGTLVGNETATNGNLGNGDGVTYNLWAGSGPGKLGDTQGAAAGGDNGAWKGDIGSQLKYFDNKYANTSSTTGQIIELRNEKIYDTSIGVSATFDIETIENSDAYTLNTDFVSSNNVNGTPFLDVKIDGSGSGVGFVDSFTIVDGGTSYSINDPINITGGGLAGGEPMINAEAQVSAVDANGAITQVTVTTQGEGYWGTPEFEIQTGSGTSANLTINMDFGYGFTKNPDGDLGNLLLDLLTWEEFTVGTISTLGSINPGAAYNKDPFVVVYNKYIASYRRGDFILELSNVSGSFRPGELLYQEVGGDEFTKGKVIDWDFDNRILKVERTSFETGFDETLQIKAKSSGASADIDNVVPLEGQNVMGDNAIVSADVIAANGIATAVEVIDSGYGYLQNGNITLESDDTPYIITGKSLAQIQGVGTGYWSTTSSHLNSEKKIHDNKYYQEFSYDVLSGLSLRRYENILKRVLHVSGTELFGTVVKRSNVPLQLSTPSGNSSITIE